MYDYLIVGSGLFGSVFAHEMMKVGKSWLVLERWDHVGGNVYCEEKEGIRIHKYGAHIFHTSNKKVWDYVNQFVEFNNYVNSPVANYKDEYLYQDVGRRYAEAGSRQDCPAASGSGDCGTEEFRRTGYFSYRYGHLYETD